MVIKILILLILGSCLGACQDAASPSSHHSSSWTTSIELKRADSIEILNGSNGQRVYINDEKHLQEMKNFLNEIEVEKETNTEIVEGFPYRIQTLADGEIKGTVTFFGDHLDVNGDSYKLQSEVDLSLLSELMKE